MGLHSLLLALRRLPVLSHVLKIEQRLADALAEYEDSPYKVVMTTSMVDPAIDKSDLCVGSHYVKGAYTLATSQPWRAPSRGYRQTERNWSSHGTQAGCC